MLIVNSTRFVNESKGTIKMRKYPKFLGFHTDIYGQEWHIEAITNNGRNVAAVPREKLHPYFTDTSTFGPSGYSQMWEPYDVEIVEE